MNTTPSPIPAALPRLLVASLFVVSGIFKIFDFGSVSGWMGSEGIPAPSAVLVLTILLEVFGGIAFGLGFFTVQLGWLLAVFTIVASLKFHAFWAVPAEQMSDQMTHFLKNLAVIGGLIALIRQARSPD